MAENFDPVGKVDYDCYQLSVREIFRGIVKSIAVTGAFAYMFYRSWMGFLAWPAVVYLILKKERESTIRRRKERLALQFKDTVLSAAAGIQAGYSVENAFLEADREMRTLHGRDCEMAKEMAWIRKGLNNRIPLEKMLEGLGKRSHVEEVRDFTESFAIAKRQGGNLKDITQRTVALTGQRMEVEREMQTLLAAKKYEQKVMNCIPFLLFGYLQLTSEGFFDILYHNLAGVVVMTLCLGMYLGAVFLSEKIIKIEI